MSMFHHFLAFMACLSLFTSFSFSPSSSSSVTPSVPLSRSFPAAFYLPAGLSAFSSHPGQKQRPAQTSEKYNPARLLSVIPSHFLEEHALLLSRLGRHEEVLHIYVKQVPH